MSWMRGISCVLLLLAAVAKAPGQEADEAPAAAKPTLRPAEFAGTEGFRSKLFAMGLEPITSYADFQQIDPAESILIVFGELSALDGIGGGFGLRRYQAAGGSVLLASDTNDRGRLRPWGVRIDGRPVFQEGRFAFSYQDQRFEECPVIRRWLLLRKTHPLVVDPQDTDGRFELVTNGPSFLESQSPAFPRLGVFGIASYVQPQMPVNGRDYLIASPAEAPPRGRTIIMAGEGAFFNGMLVHGNNDTFAANCIRWLREAPDNRQRKHVLFIDQGEIVTNFRVSLMRLKVPTEPPVPEELPEMTPELAQRLLQNILANPNAFVHQLEKNNFFNRLVDDWFGRENLLRFFLALTTLAVLIYACQRFVRSRYRLEKYAPLVASTLEPGDPVPPAYTQRRQGLHKINEFRAAIQPLARQWFWKHVNIDPAAWDVDPTPELLVECNAGWWQRWTLTRKVHAFEKLARASSMDHVSRSRIMKLRDDLRTLNEAMRAGVLRIRFA